MLYETDLGVIRQIPAFAGLPVPALRQVLSGATVAPFPDATVLFHQGEYPDFLYVLLEGRVSLIGVGGGDQTVVDVVPAMETFVLASALTAQPYLVTARALSASRLLLLPAADLRRLVLSEPALADGMLQVLARHYRRMVRQNKDLKLRSSTQRLGCHLLTLAAHQKSTSRVTLPYEKRTLAAELGMTPENLSRAFASLRRYRVEVRGQHVILGDIPGLRDYCRPDEIDE